MLEHDETWKAGRTHYALKEPIKLGTEEIADLWFRPLRAKDLRGLPVRLDQWDHTLEIAGKLCGRGPQVIDLLGASDIAGVSDIITGFLDPGRPTGVAG